MNNINIIIQSSLLFLSVLFFLFAIIIIFKNYKFLNIFDGDIDEKQNSVKIFLQTLETLLKFTIRKIVRFWKLYFHYFILYTLKTIDLVNVIFGLIYSKLRNHFISKSTENKALVVHFWRDLKRYKREKDKEESADKKD